MRRMRSIMCHSIDAIQGPMLQHLVNSFENAIEAADIVNFAFIRLRWDETERRLILPLHDSLKPNQQERALVDRTNQLHQSIRVVSRSSAGKTNLRKVDGT